MTMTMAPRCLAAVTTTAACRRGAAVLHRSRRTTPPAAPTPTRAFQASAVARGGGGHHHLEPPLPPFQRSPPKQASLIENYDALWDDGVAPELALDFDMPSLSTSEALATWATAFGLFFGLYQGIRLLFTTGDDNPALPHAADCVDVDWSDRRVVVNAAATVEE